MSTITMTNTDPGEGSALPADNYLAVYGGIGLLDLFYPVGSYYKTANVSFNPNTSWGGVWEEDTDYDLVAYLKTNGTTIRASKNIDRINKVDTGKYNVILSKQMANTDGIIEVSAEANNVGSEIICAFWDSVTTFTVDCSDHTGAAVDPLYLFITVYGRLSAPEFKKWKRVA